AWAKFTGKIADEVPDNPAMEWGRRLEAVVITINGTFTFQSDENGTAQLAEFTGSITGNVTAERFVPAKRAFRFLSSPVGNVAIADAWQQQTHITGAQGTVGQTSANGFDQTLSGAPSMFTYDHSLPDQINNDAWLPLTSTTQNIEAGKPYRLFVRGERSTIDLSSDPADDATDVTLSATGTLHTGNFDVEISDFQGNFTFVGNPYQAVVDINAINFGADVNDSFIYYWDASLSDRGAFATIELPTGTSVSTTNADEFLRPGQAFFIKNNASGSDFSIQFNEDDKVTSGSQTQVFSNENDALSLINIRLYTQEAFTTNEREQDAMGLRFSTEGNNEIDEKDAVKMFNIDENLASLNNNQLLSIENRNLPEDQEVIQLITHGYTSDNYIFWLDLQNLPEGTTAFLKDQYTDELIALDNGINEIPFNVDSSIEESSSLFRFTLEFDVDTFSNAEFESANFKFYPNPVSANLVINLGQIQAKNTQVNVFDVAGRSLIQTNFKHNQSELEIDVSKLSAGLYFVEVKEGNKKQTHKIIKK
ncbi:MAG: T9SS type A sorting domain-containing protein, partial [Psychroflexus maritimus]